jgi:hypothetical protein
MENETSLTDKTANRIKPVVTCWLDFGEQMPNPMQEIYVLDKFGDIKPTINQGDWQKDYWVTNGYLWSARPACR